MYLRDSGKPLAHVWRLGWLESSLVSSLGVYGLAGVVAPASHYPIAGMALTMLVLVLALATWHARTPGGRLVLGVTGVAVLLALLQSLLLSWLYSYQPQGRYLFPILPMLVVALAPGAKLVPGRMLAFFALVPLGLSLWSFVAVGLERIPR